MKKTTSSKKLVRLTGAKAYELYKAGYPDDTYTLSYMRKPNPSVNESVRKEMQAIVNAPTLEEACKLAISFYYGSYGDASKWESHADPIGAIRKAFGIKDLDYSAKSIWQRQGSSWLYL